MDVLEERCLVDDGEAILNKKAVYEPTKGQRFRQIICSKGWAIFILLTMGVVMVAIAVIAAFARPGYIFSPGSCNLTSKDRGDQETGDKGTEDFKATNGEIFPWKDIRLPQSVKPNAYRIFLHTNISESHFNGNVVMTLNIQESTNFIVFHSEGLNLSSLQIFEKDNPSAQDNSQPSYTRAVPVTQYLEYTGHHQVYVEVDTELKAGTTVQLHVNFRGYLDDNGSMHGFYKSSYMVGEEKRYMVSTQFEAQHARKAFPCMDEPEMKAHFSMSMVRDKKHITLFNTEMENTAQHSNGLELDTYKSSVKMSTYLVAYVICDFEFISNETKSGIKVRVFAPEDKIHMGRYALDAAVTILEKYNEFFGLPYPLSKLDLIAIPNFSAGAMENWGLVTYRDTAILYDPKMSDAGDKQWVATVVAHELAHQWFGNLVTMKWWDDLWLNEGFASFVENIGADEVDKDFHMMDGFMSTFTGALHSDGFATSHPIKMEVKDPADVEAGFDSITYNKGASLIRMLKSVLGNRNFKSGLRHYLQSHAYGNAETNDLWKAMQKFSDLPDGLTVPDMMDTWTKQMGYPVVTVTKQNGQLVLTQERFLLHKAEDPDKTQEEEKFPSPYDYKWDIPFTYITSENPSQMETVWLIKGPARIDLNDVGSNLQWIKGNYRSKGFYRVNYDENGWKAIIAQLKENHMVFSVADRAELVDDVCALARAGLVSYKIALDLLSYMEKETEYIVWVQALPSIGFISNQIYLEESFDDLKAYVLELATPLATSLGWEDKGNFLERKLRSLILSFIINIGHQPSVDQALQIFKRWKADDSLRMNNNLRKTVYYTGIKYGNKKDWDLVFQRYQQCNVPSEKGNLLKSLSAPRDARILQILLDYSLDTTKVKSQDTVKVVRGVAYNKNGVLLAWRFLRMHWDTLHDRYAHTSFMLSSMVKSVTAHFNIKFDYDEVDSFFANKDLGSAKMALAVAKEAIRSNIAWMEKYLEPISEWLQDYASRQ